jgi:hypothetical protein
MKQIHPSPFGLGVNVHIFSFAREASFHNCTRIDYPVSVLENVMASTADLKESLTHIIGCPLC